MLGNLFFVRRGAKFVSRKSASTQPVSRSRRSYLALERLEERSLLTVFTVLNTNDSGVGSLRQALLDANASPDADTIAFNIPGPAPYPVQVRSALPAIADPTGLVLDGTTQPNYQGLPLIVIDGTSVPSGTTTNGLVVTAGSNTIRGLIISLFTGTGLVLQSNGNVVEGNYIGTDSIASVANPNQGDGIFVNSSNNLIGGTTISGTGYPARNIISGNAQRGIRLVNASNNRIQGNHIGTNRLGNGGVGNRQAGIAILNGCQNNLIGTNGDGIDDVAERNVISGNGFSGAGFSGLGINDPTARNNTVAGNYIGTNAAGTAALGNRDTGVFLGAGTQFNIIGTNGDESVGDGAEGNLISGNQVDGIRLNGTNTSFNVVAGNYIGTNAAGTQFLRNQRDGIQLLGGSSRNRIGTDGNGQADDLERNVISGNNASGVVLFNSDSNILAGNYIGSTASGTAGLGNQRHGIYLSDRSDNNRIGTDGNGTADEAERNVIANNGFVGVEINNSRSNRVAGNHIGTGAGGTGRLGNGGLCEFPGCEGVRLGGGSQLNVIGVVGDGAPGEAARRNVISANTAHGIGIEGTSTIQNVVAGNYVGTTAAGDRPLPNNRNGVAISGGARQNRIGTNSDGISDDLERNVIGATGFFGNGFAAISINNGNGNSVAGNYVGTDATGTFALAGAWNIYGVLLGNGSVNNLIGGTTATARNVISANIFGVGIADSNTTGNRVQGNYIGTQADGVSPLGNLAHGVFLFGDTSGNTVGGSTPEAGNVIAYNGGSGVVVDSGITNTIRLNSLVANVGLGIDLGADGVTPNQEVNPLPGPNNWQNYPTLTQAREGATSWVAGDIVSVPNATITLDFYASTVADPTGYGQGGRYLGSLQVQTDENGAATFADMVGGETFQGEFVTATATTESNGTSEFSAAVVVELPAGPRGGSGASLLEGLRTTAREAAPVPQETPQFQGSHTSPPEYRSRVASNPQATPTRPGLAAARQAIDAWALDLAREDGLTF